MDTTIHLPGTRASPEIAPLGMAITPKNFPAHRLADVDETFGFAHQLANHSVFIFQWGELDLEVARLMMVKS